MIKLLAGEPFPPDLVARMPAHTFRLLLTIVLASTSPLWAEEPPDADAVPEFSKESLVFFEKEIRPLLVQHCQKCHGPDKQSGELRLDHRAGFLSGGDSGAAIVPGHPDDSLLMEALRWESYEMPPSGKLDDTAIAKLERWIKMGAPWPQETGPRIEKKEKITKEDRQWWAYQPIADPQPPTLPNDDWSRNAIDTFVLKRLRDAGLSPANQADRRTLIRRASYTLTGLPPTADEIDAFVSDASADAWERLIDRLLESPRYGEHWGKHWLDLVRYAESDGYKQDAYRPNAWRYRDYVIQSLNADKPYDQFIREQLAGDEIAPEDSDALIATGFLHHGIYEYNQRDAMTQWAGMVDEVTDTTADTFLALGYGCAKCHDHKFDPILQVDYYRLRGFFTPLWMETATPVASSEQKLKFDRQQQAWEHATADVRAKLDAIEAPIRAKLARVAIVKFPDEVEEMALKPEADRSPFEKQLAEMVMRQVNGEYAKVPKSIPKDKKEEWARLQKELKSFDHLKPAPLPTARTVRDVASIAPPTMIPGKERLGDIAPGFMTLLDPEPAHIATATASGTRGVVPAPGLQTTGRRTALANWIASADNPLTARVMVNRIWQQHFGEGLVSTPSDFGHLGEPPSHPQLLDWLASRFIESGWSVKEMHRRILTSSTWRQAAIRAVSDSAVVQRAMMVDPGNRLLWRMRIRRLSAEQIRDSMLKSAGILDLKSGGESVTPGTPRRSVYTKLMRNSKDPLLAAFDIPEGLSSTPRRNVTTTPTQSLMMINGDETLRYARALAARAIKNGGTDRRSNVAEAFRLIYGRKPTSDELQTADLFLEASGADSSTSSETRIAKTGDPAIRIDAGQTHGPMAARNSGELTSDRFTIAATIQLDSLYPDATVRTIASQWNNSKDSPGWALGVTSTKSAYQPKNLILQFVGEDQNGKITYEVVASNLRIQLGTPYRVTVTVDLRDTSESGVVFELQNLKDASKPQHAAVEHEVVALTKPVATQKVATTQNPQSVASIEHVRSRTPLVLGGREKSSRHQWDGLIAKVRYDRDAIASDRLGETKPAAAWMFQPGMQRLADHTGNGFDLESVEASVSNEAFVDFCHVLLNSNEFLYVD